MTSGRTGPTGIRRSWPDRDGVDCCRAQSRTRQDISPNVPLWTFTQSYYNLNINSLLTLFLTLT